MNQSKKEGFGIMKVLSTYYKNSIFKSALSQGIFYSGSLLNLIYYLFQDSVRLPSTILVTTFVYSISELGLAWLVPRSSDYTVRAFRLRSIQVLCYITIMIAMSFWYQFDFQYILLHLTVIAFPAWMLFYATKLSLLAGLSIFRLFQIVIFFMPLPQIFAVLNILCCIFVLFTLIKFSPRMEDLKIIRRNLFFVIPKILPVLVMAGLGFIITIIKASEVNEYVFIERHKSLLATFFVPVTYFIFLSYDSWRRSFIVAYVLSAPTVMFIASVFLGLDFRIYLASVFSFFSSAVIHFYFLIKKDIRSVSIAVISQVTIVVLLSSLYLWTNYVPTSIYLALAEFGLLLSVIILYIFKKKHEHSQL